MNRYKYLLWIIRLSNSLIKEYHAPIFYPHCTAKLKRIKGREKPLKPEKALPSPHESNEPSIQA